MTFVVNCGSFDTSSNVAHARRPRPTASDRRRCRRIAMVAALYLLAGCSWGRGGPKADNVPRIVWPEPPEQARIELVSVFSGASELGIERSIWTRLANLITGGADVQMVRPTGIAVSSERIAVADPGAGVVHVYDLSRHRAVVLAACRAVALGEPVGVAMLADRIYVSDSARARIDVFDSAGDCEASWELESGSRPAGVAADSSRARLYVADVGAHRVLGFDPQGNVILRIGNRGIDAGEFNYPTWVAVDDAGNLYVTDSLNFRVQIFDPNGTPTGAFGDQGDSSGQLARPKGIGVDRDGHLYLVDALFDAVQLFGRDGRYLMVFGGQGREPGHFWLPSGLAVDHDRIFVADSYNRRVQVFRFLGGGS